MEKVIHEGLVAVLYSPEYGSGWLTCHGILELVFDPKVVQMVETQQSAETILSYCKTNYGKACYYGGYRNLEITWIPLGTRFRIEEYDGWETVITENDEEYITA